MWKLYSEKREGFGYILIRGHWHGGKFTLSFLCFFLIWKWEQKHGIWQLLTKSDCSEHVVIWLPRLLGQSSIVIDYLAIVYLYIQPLIVVITCSNIWLSFFISSFKLSFPSFSEQIFMEHLLYEWHCVKQWQYNDNPYFIELIFHTSSVKFFLASQG